MGFGRWGSGLVAQVWAALSSLTNTTTITETTKNKITLTQTLLNYSIRDNSPIQTNKTPFLCRRDCSTPFSPHTHTFKVNKKNHLHYHQTHPHTQAIIKWTTIIKQIIITIMRVTSKQTNKTKKRKKIVAKTIANKQPASKSVCLMFSFSVSSF